MTGPTHTCKNCGTQFTGRFCNQCGEKVYSEYARSFKHLAEEVFHFITHFEGTFFNTLKAMFTKPGKVSADFCGGVRKKYFKPLSFFLMLVIVYLLFPVFEGLNMKLKYYQSNPVFGKYATVVTAKVQEEKKYTDEQMEEVFHRKGEKSSKFLLFLIVPCVALVSYLLGFKKRKYYYDHFIFSTEIVSFFILFGFLLLPFTLRLLMLMKVKVYVSEAIIAGIIFTALGFYTGFAARRFFNFRKIYSVFYALIFALALAYTLEIVYKFVLFNIAVRLI